MLSGEEKHKLISIIWQEMYLADVRAIHHEEVSSVGLSFSYRTDIIL